MLLVDCVRFYPNVFEIFSRHLLPGWYRQGKAETLFPFSKIKTFCLGSPHYWMCLQPVQTQHQNMHKRLILSPLFMVNGILLVMYSLKSAGLAGEYADIDFESWTRIPYSSQILHFSEMLLTVLTVLKLDVAGVPYWQLQFDWCCAAQDVQSCYISRHRKCNPVSEYIKRKRPFKVQGVIIFMLLEVERAFNAP